MACAAALAVQQVIARDGLLQKVQDDAPVFERMLRGALGDHPHVGDIRGRGYFWGIELVADRATKAPFDPALRLHARVKKAAMDAGLLCYPFGGTVEGLRGDHVLLAPPYIAAREDLQAIADLLAHAIGQATAGLA